MELDKALNLSKVTQTAAPSVLHHTFWTCCDKCNMHYEYIRICVNKNLRCPNCFEPFTAVEIPEEPSRSFPWAQFNRIAVLALVAGAKPTKRRKTVLDSIKAAPEAAVKAIPEAAVTAAPRAAVEATPEDAVEAAPNVAVKTARRVSRRASVKAAPKISVLFDYTGFWMELGREIIINKQKMLGEQENGERLAVSAN